MNCRMNEREEREDTNESILPKAVIDSAIGPFHATLATDGAEFKLALILLSVADEDAVHVAQSKLPVAGVNGVI